MKELLKTVKAAKTEKKAAAPKTVKRTKFAFVPEPGAPYGAIKGDRAIFSALTMAAAIHSGLVNTPAKGALTKGRSKGDMELFRAIVGGSASGYWTGTGRIDKDAMTAKGLNELGRRLNGEGAYKTTRETVQTVLALLQKGGTIKVKGTDVKFAHQVPKA